MPIEPIKSFSRNPTGFENILARGGSALTTIVRESIQVGRNAANLQQQQERDFLTEQRREIALGQRKAENLRQDIEDDRRFEEDQFQFDVKFQQEVDEFDRRIEEGTLDRGVREKGLALDAELGRGRLANEGRRINQADAAQKDRERNTTIRQGELDATKSFNAKKLESLNLEVESAKNDRDRDAAQAKASEERDRVRSQSLKQFDEAVKTGNLGDAQSIHRSILSDPLLEMPATQLRSLERQAFPELAESTSKEENELTFEEAQGELDDLTKVSEDRELTSTQAERKARLERFLLQRPDSKPSKARRRSIAEDLRRRGAGSR